jgi:2-iminobutanoate/2-iminopropanoate deaminase
MPDQLQPVQLQPVTARNLPAPVGPYSPGMVVGNLVFVSGQAGRDPASGRLAGDTIEAQTEQVLKNIATILEAAGTTLQHVIRCGVFIVDMKEFPRMNEVYARVFGAHRPARTTVEVSGLPGEGLRVEIDAVAVLLPPRGGSRETREM